MVGISIETPEQTEARLRGVLKLARMEILPGSYAFLEFPLVHGVMAARSDALALVRDEEVWSQLVPCDNAQEECFSLFRFHFPPSLDNSGFVGWLATRLKQRFGTGVFVVCGQNRRDGGIFDYWGVPLAAAPAVLDEVKGLTTP